MRGEPPSQETTLAVILGASRWLKHPDLDSAEVAPAFENSARRFKNYITGVTAKVRDLFNEPGAPADINEEIEKFLKENLHRPIRDLIIYYVGHGGFTRGGDQAYFLALLDTKINSEGFTGLRMVDFARTLKQDFLRDVRKYLILDCCFAEAAYKHCQFGGTDLAKLVHTKSLQDLLPGSGTALLCASSERDVALIPKGESYTMFSGQLLEVLEEGDQNVETALSLEQVGQQVSRRISTKYTDIAVRPKVSSPEEREGDVADIPLFPNAAHLPRLIEERVTSSERKLELILAKLHVLDDLSIQLPDLREKVTTLERRTDGSGVGSPREAEGTVQGSSRPLSRLEERETTLNKAPPLVQVEVQRFRRARMHGFLWFFLSLLLSGAGAFPLATAFTPLGKYFPESAQPEGFWHYAIQNPFGWLVLALATFSLALLFLQGRKNLPATAAASVSPSTPESWENLPIILLMRSTRLIRVFGDFTVSSPLFEIGAVPYILTAALLIFASFTSALGGNYHYLLK